MVHSGELRTKAHSIEAPHVARELRVDPTIGLTEEEVAKRRREWGPNVLPAVQQRRVWEMLRDQIVNIVVLLLVVAAAISWFTGDHLQAVAIVVVLLLNALAGFVTEWQAGRAL